MARGLSVRLTLRRRQARFLDFDAVSSTVAMDGLDAAPPPARRPSRLSIRRNDLFMLAPPLLLLVGSIGLRWLPGIIMALAGLLGVLWYTQRKGARRNAQLEVQLVPALQMMAAGLHSGYSVQQALERVARDTLPPISEEFAQVSRAVALGTPLEDALTTLVENGGENFQFFATIVAVQHRVGGDLPALLSSLATSVQERLQLKAEVRALTAQARYSGYVLIALPFALFGVMMLTSPDYVSPLLTTDFGRVMLLVAGVLLAAGVGSIRAISNVAV